MKENAIRVEMRLLMIIVNYIARGKMIAIARSLMKMTLAIIGIDGNTGITCKGSNNAHRHD